MQRVYTMANRSNPDKPKRRAVKARKRIPDLHIGDRVLVMPFASAPGTVKRIDGHKVFVAIDNGFVDQIEVDITALEPMSAEIAEDLKEAAAHEQQLADRLAKLKQKKIAPTAPSLHTRDEIDLHKYTYEHAFERTTQFIDEALAADLESVRIIHGHGTGQVRRAVEQALKQHPRVASFMQLPNIAAITINLK